MIAEMVNIDKETVRQVLHEDLNMTKVCAKVVPRLLTPEQKENRKRRHFGANSSRFAFFR
jgi:hypothetical protein